MSEKREGLGFSWNHQHGDPTLDFYANVARVFRKQRMYLGLTQAMLAKRLGYTDRFIKYLENGSRRPKFFTASRICSVLGLKIHDLSRPWQTTGDGDLPQPLRIPRSRKRVVNSQSSE